MSSLCSSTADLTIKYKYHPTDEEFLEKDNLNIVLHLFNNGLLNAIECRKIVLSNNVGEIRAAIYEIIVTKDAKNFKIILEAFRNRLHQFQNPVILQRIFSHLKYADLTNCKLVCPDWGQIVDFLFISKYDDVKLEIHLLSNLLAKNETIKFEKNKSCPRNIADLEASVFQTMLAIDPEMDEIMLKSLNIGSDIVPDASSSSIEILSTPETQNYNLIAKVMGNHTVLTTVFQFLSLTSIKNCRRVCRTWHSLTEPFLRKLSTIKFSENFRPIDFLNVSKYLPFPDLHFKAFKFRLECQVNKRLRKLEEKNPCEGLSEFLTQFGKNIKSLDMCGLIDIRSCLLHTLNLTELNLQGATRSSCNIYRDPDPMTMIPWKSLHSIKILNLRDTVIEVDNNKEWKRITPLKVKLFDVRFFVGLAYSTEMTLNDYIDFTKVKDVDVRSANGWMNQFDWARDTFYAENMRFSNIRFANVEKSKSSVDCLELYDSQLSVGSSVSIKQLIFGIGELSLAALPPSIERLSVVGQNCTIITGSTEQIYLPNLKYLNYQRIDELNLWSHFRNYPNLTVMEIRSMIYMNIWCLPKNIKRLKVISPSGQLYFVDGVTAECFDLDLLILDYIDANHLNHLKFDKLRPKVLVIEVAGDYDDEAFVSFIRRNKNIAKIFIEFREPVQPFSGSQLSNLVDKELPYYEFSSERGKAITSQEFLAMQGSLCRVIE